MGLFEFFKKNNKNKEEDNSNNKSNVISKSEHLTPLGEMLLVLFNEKTIAKVKQQISSGNQLTPIDSHNMNFRLFLSKKGNVNLEVFIKNKSGMYFKPIGFYNILNENISITILKEFEQSFEKDIVVLNKNINVKYLTLIENGYIAAGSLDAVPIVQDMFNNPPKHNPNAPLGYGSYQSKKFTSNGLKITIKTSIMESLETLLDEDDYELDDDHLLIMYRNIDGISLHSNDNIYMDLLSKDLISAFKRL
jgi:hypothetical protein